MRRHKYSRSKVKHSKSKATKTKEKLILKSNKSELSKSNRRRRRYGPYDGYHYYDPDCGDCRNCDSLFCGRGDDDPSESGPLWHDDSGSSSFHDMYTPYSFF